MTYESEQPPVDNEVTDWARRQFDSIAAALRGDLSITYVAPTKPRDGQFTRADGVEWDPGSGRGIYIYDEALWKLVVAL